MCVWLCVCVSVSNHFISSTLLRTPLCDVSLPSPWTSRAIYQSINQSTNPYSQHGSYPRSLVKDATAAEIMEEAPAQHPSAPPGHHPIMQVTHPKPRRRLALASPLTSCPSPTHQPLVLHRPAPHDSEPSRPITSERFPARQPKREPVSLRQTGHVGLALQRLVSASGRRVCFAYLGTNVFPGVARHVCCAISSHTC